jgi:DNA-binding NarL/FixJ family response regulator
MVKVMVVDDHALIRRVLREVLWQENDLEIVAEACNGFEAEIQAAKTQPDVVLMDLDMPGRGGLEATERVLSCSPRSRVIILTASRCEHHAVSAIQRGAVGYLTKDVEPETLIYAIRCAVRDELYLARPLAGRVLAQLRSMQLPKDMDPLERRITLASKQARTAFSQAVTASIPVVRGQVQPAMPGTTLTEHERGFLDRVRRGFRKHEAAGQASTVDSIAQKQGQHTASLPSFRVKLVSVH